MLWLHLTPGERSLSAGENFQDPHQQEVSFIFTAGGFMNWRPGEKQGEVTPQVYMIVHAMLFFFFSRMLTMSTQTPGPLSHCSGHI